MKKLKISELPICSTLAGLFTIGVDNLNRSVKVSLQFVEDKVTEAVSKAMAATTSANSAAQAAQTAKTDTETATAQAQAATADAKTATGKANEATAAALSAALSASQKAEAANTATEEAKAATAAANKATETALKTVEDTKTETAALISETKTATETLIEEAQTETAQAIKETEEATAAAQAATADVLAKIAILIPSALTVEAPRRITWGNMERFVIKTVLSPVTAMRNLIFISDNKAVEVSTDGVLTPVAKGVSRVHVIPTQNTALARTCVIEVGDPRLRLSSQTALRFTQAGGLRLT